MKTIIKALYAIITSLLYEGTHKSDKLDSRTVSKPRPKNATERSTFNARSNLPCSILSYANKDVHACIYWFKYKRDKYTTKLLARILEDEILAETSKFNFEWIITAAPSTSFSIGEKTWDHNLDLMPYISFTYKKIFTVSKEVVSNKKLRRTERIKYSKNKFALATDKNLEGHGLIIIDDVTTTGSTLNNLGHLALKLKPRKIITLAIAH